MMDDQPQKHALKGIRACVEETKDLEKILEKHHNQKKLYEEKRCL